MGPIHKFTGEEAAGGVILLLSAQAALAWAKLPWSQSYHNLWETHMRIGISTWALDEPLEFWINDALVAIFFVCFLFLQK